MSFFKYLTAHFFFALFIFLVGYYVAKQFPGLFGTLPLVGSGKL